VERAAWLDAPGTEVWIKRDDESSSLYGGGKVRKLEWLLANPPYAGPRPIVSVGGIGSHHLVALALFLRERGRRLHAWTFLQPPTPHVVRNLAVLASCDVQLTHVHSRLALPLAALRYYFGAPPGQRGVFMPPGASAGLGILGFVAAGLELAAQIDAGQLPSPARIYVTAGTAGTAAGLIAGLRLAGVATHLRIVSSVERIAFNGLALRSRLAAAHRTLLELGLARDLAERLHGRGVTWSIEGSEGKVGYGVATQGAREAVDLARAQGLELETTYTGKCLAVLRRELAQGSHGDARSHAEPVLFWNTHAGADLSARIVPGWEARLPAALRRALP
jgi:D-cysteine desulfhydrase